MKENLTAASVDIAAIDIVIEGGYCETFIYWVGHGIGIKGMDLYKIQDILKSSNLSDSP